MDRIKARKIAVIVSLILIMPLLTACWGYREVDKMSIVVGVAIDKGTTDKYLVTYEVVDFSQMKVEGKAKSILVKSEGDTLLEASRNAISKNFPRLYFGHSTIVVVSKEIASEGILDVIDSLCRDNETRLSMHLLVSEEETAGELLKVKPLDTALLSTEINNILIEEKYLSKAIPFQTYEFVNCVMDQGISCAMTTVCIEKKEEEELIKLCGTAVFKHDKLLGFIDEEETKALSFILDKVKGGVNVVKIGSGDDESRFSLEIIRSNTKLKPTFKDKKLSIEIDVKVVVTLGEHISNKDYGTEEGIKQLSKVAEEQLRDDLERLINKIKTEYVSDIFGFGNSVYKHYPKLWKEIKDDWDNEFKNIEVSIKPEIKILNTGILNKSIKIGE